MGPELPDSLRGLLTPRAYPHPAAAVELIETHVSWVLLAGEFAYKIKRPVRHPFVDQLTPARRKLLCEEELRLNRRFAPQLYLEVCRVIGTGASARIADAGAEDPVLEYAVRMRRFPADEALDRLLAAGRIEPAELEDLGRRLAALHAGFPDAPPQSPWGRPADVQALMVRNLLECAAAAAALGTDGAVLALRGPLQRSLTRHEAAMAARRAAGRIRECHGDLHARNIVRLGGRLVAFDCLEYEPAFRWIDVADEVAFLSSDLQARERPLHAHAFLGGYLAEGGDYGACRVLRLYEAHRALVRAKIAALEAAAAPQGPQREPRRGEHRRLIEHAASALADRSPALLILCGLSGSGKTWLARQLAARLSAVHVRSDVERKRRAGLAELARTRSGIGAGLYSPQMSAAVYEDLSRAAESILEGGLDVIVDAAFLRRGQRARFAELGDRLGAKRHVVYCDAPLPMLRARVAARADAGRDASEADTTVLDWQLSELERPSSDGLWDVIDVDTTAPAVLESVLRRLA